MSSPSFFSGIQWASAWKSPPHVASSRGRWFPCASRPLDPWEKWGTARSLISVLMQFPSLKFQCPHKLKPLLLKDLCRPPSYSRGTSWSRHKFLDLSRNLSLLSRKFPLLVRGRDCISYVHIRGVLCGMKCLRAVTFAIFFSRSTK